MTGRVQGVGFRFFVKERARTFQLTGWVRNLPDGRVVCEVEGSRETVERFIDALRKGPPLSRVDHVAVSWGPGSDQFSAFEIRS